MNATREESGRYLVKTPIGEFHISALPRRYVRARNGPGRHVREWTLNTAPAGYEDHEGLVAQSKRDLLKVIEELAFSRHPAAPAYPITSSIEERLTRIEELLTVLVDKELDRKRALRQLLED